MRLHEDIDDTAFFDDAPGIKNGDAIADLFDHFHLMRDEHDRQTEFAIDLAQQIENRARGFGIECGRAFIG